MTSTKMTWKTWTILVPLLTATTLLCVPAVGQSKTQPVLVVNGAGKPVPTTAQGTTNVAGTINIGNTPSVSVANTPSVNVANTPTVNLVAGGSVNITNPPNGQNNPIPLAVLEAIQPYNDQCSMSFSGVDSQTCTFRAIPPGKRIVIQEFDALGWFEAGLKPASVALGTHVGNSHFFTATFMSDRYSLDLFATHQETHLYYSSSNNSLFCVVTSSAQSNSGFYQCDLSGFLVDVP